MRVSLSYGGRKILLHQGETIIGRALHCGVRFNDPAVSREHARVTVSAHGRPVLENLSRSNGTTLNGATLSGPHELADGDRIGLGQRILSVELIEEVRVQQPRPITLDSGLEAEPGSGLLVDEESAADESTQPGTLDRRSFAPGAVAVVAAQPGPEDQYGLFDWHNCPRCRASVAYSEDTCPKCGYAWPPGRPGAVTLEIRPTRRDARSEPRFPIELPVIYSSDGLTFEATVRDISRGGVFVATELLEPVGTECELTALPDGHPALTFHGQVAHVATLRTDGGRPAGLGIQFTEIPPKGRRWLAALLGLEPEK